MITLAAALIQLPAAVNSAAFVVIAALVSVVSQSLWNLSGPGSKDFTNNRIPAGAGSDDDQFPRVINGVLGTKMRVVSGYPGGNDVVLAMERGEVNGRCG